MSEDLRRQLTEAQAREEKATLLLLETARHLDCDDLDAIPAMIKRQLAEALAREGQLQEQISRMAMGEAGMRDEQIEAAIKKSNREALTNGREHLTISGKFRSDKYPWCHDGFVPLKVTDSMAQDLLAEYARRRATVDAEFSRDLLEALAAPAPEDPISKLAKTFGPPQTLSEAYAAYAPEQSGTKEAPKSPPLITICPATPEGTPLVKTDDRKPIPKSETKRRVVEAAKKWHVDRSLSVRHGRESSETLYEELMGACEALAAQQQGGS